MNSLLLKLFAAALLAVVPGLLPPQTLNPAQMVPMREPPTAKILQWRSQPAEQRDAEAIRKFALELGQTLEKQCGIL